VLRTRIYNVHVVDRGTLVERNRLFNNARGIGFGLGAADTGRTYSGGVCPGATDVGHFEGEIRNNFIAAWDSGLFASAFRFDTGISLAQSCNTRVLHNSIASTQAPYNSIEWRFASTSVTLTNNLATHVLMQRDNATATQAGNIASVNANIFVDVATGDLHLKPGSAPLGQGVAGSGVTADLDGDARSGTAPDVGADEQ
jgi:hypothetical protein